MSRIDRLNSKVLDAHKNKALNILVDIYLMLGIEELNKSKIKSGCFLITQAYVYALEDNAETILEGHRRIESGSTIGKITISGWK